MGKNKNDYRRLVIAANLKRLIGKGGIISIADFATKHGSNVRTVKRWRKEGVDSLATVVEISSTLEVPFLSLILTDEEKLERSSS